MSYLCCWLYTYRVYCDEFFCYLCTDQAISGVFENIPSVYCISYSQKRKWQVILESTRGFARVVILFFHIFSSPDTISLFCSTCAIFELFPAPKVSPMRSFSDRRAKKLRVSILNRHIDTALKTMKFFYENAYSRCYDFLKALKILWAVYCL